ncbi:hypothetical protein DXG01_007712 [Tephrocybe rancida]|nr:hypothetical protein DXG01_007712 [Tephrocybe rancida]
MFTSPWHRPRGIRSRSGRADFIFPLALNIPHHPSTSRRVLSRFRRPTTGHTSHIRNHPRYHLYQTPDPPANFERDQTARAAHAEWCISSRETIILLGRRRREELCVKIRGDLHKALQERLKREEDAFVVQERVRDEFVATMLSTPAKDTIKLINQEDPPNTKSQEPKLKPEDLEDNMYRRTTGKFWLVPWARSEHHSDAGSAASPIDSLSPPQTPQEATSLPTPAPEDEDSALLTPNHFPEGFDYWPMPVQHNADPHPRWEVRTQGLQPSISLSSPHPPSTLRFSTPDELPGSQINPIHKCVKAHSALGIKVPLIIRAVLRRRNDLDAFDARFALAQERRYHLFLDEAKDMQARFESAEDVRDKAEAHRDKAYDLVKPSMTPVKPRRERAFETWDAQCAEAFELEILHIHKQVSARDAHEDAVETTSLHEPLEALIKGHKGLVYAARKALDA